MKVNRLIPVYLFFEKLFNSYANEAKRHYSVTSSQI